MREDVRRDWDWSDRYSKLVREICCRELAQYIMRAIVASPNDDMKHATDFVMVPTNAGTIAARLRRPLKERDFTVRSWRVTGAETEMSKLKRRLVRWYFYGWTNRRGELEEWVIIDLEKLLSDAAVFDGRREKKNKDETTAFIHVSVDELVERGCLVAKRLKQTSLFEEIRRVQGADQCDRCGKRLPDDQLILSVAGKVCIACGEKDRRLHA